MHKQWVSNGTTTNPADLFNQIIYDLEDVVGDLQLYLEAPFQGNATVFIPVSSFSNICNESVIRNTDYYYNGRCFTLSIPHCIVKLGILELILNFNKNVDIFIHHEGQFFSPNSRARVDVKLGENKKIAVNHEVQYCHNLNTTSTQSITT